MTRRSKSIGRGIMVVIAALCTATVTTLAAQQPTGVVQQPSSPNSALSGPRLQAEWPRYEPRVAEHTSPAALAAAGGSHTIVFSTLALVIIGVIVLVLVL